MANSKELEMLEEAQGLVNDAVYLIRAAMGGDDADGVGKSLAGSLRELSEGQACSIQKLIECRGGEV
jgi:hypothetical protein